MSNITEKMNPEQKEIYDKYKNEFPFKIVEFINELGIKVFAENLPSNHSGYIEKKNNEYHIHVNEAHSSTRIRFTLAHELGHFFYDGSYLDQHQAIIDSSKQAEKKLFRHGNISLDNPDMREMDVRANKFAAELLMPEKKFIEIWHTEYSPERVALFFNVSVEATKIRAANLIGEIL